MNHAMIEKKKEINELNVGAELDEKVAIEVLGFKKSGLVQEMTLPNGKTTTTNYMLENGQPAIIPPLTQDNNLAIILLQDMNKDLKFEFSKGLFKASFDDEMAFKGSTMGEVIGKTLLFEVAKQQAKGEIIT